MANKNNENSKFADKLPMGDELSFESSEAYNLLRTNVNFSFADSDECKIIGVTSALKSEGKSTISLNLAYSFALTEKKVLAIEGDLRLPTFAKKLDIAKTVGMTDVIVGQVKAEDAIIKNVLTNNMDVLPAGSVPPNATQLLESSKTEQVLKELSKDYDYIIIDLPPVMAVSDALIVSKLISGILVVVRADHVTKKELADTMRQLKYVKANVLGFVYSAESSTSSYNYKKKKYDYYSK